MSSHSSRASDESRPADDTGRRPEIPASVGTMINMQRGDAREFFFADTAADDGDDVLSSGSETAPRCPTCVERKERKVLKNQTWFPLQSKHAGHLLSLLRSGDTSGTSRRSAKAGDSAVPGSFSSEEIRRSYQAWNFIDGALQSEADRSILKRCKSPKEAFDHLEKWYDPESEVVTQTLYDKFHDSTISPNGNPIEELHAL